MKFVDIVEVKVKSGDGGRGMSHFRREKYVPTGGPDGGNGGKGGNVILQGDEGLQTLLDFHFQGFYEAQKGAHGGTNRKAGRSGEDITVKVPVGTIIYDQETQESLGELLTDKEQILICEGGRGGIGNSCFPSSRNQAPTRTVPPGPGIEKTLRFELKLIADVGIIGSPNAGKSTLISVISSAKPKIADYPFTTLVPNLGVVSHRQNPPFVIADVPGLIEGASQGKGLGHDFLRHVERTKVLVHLIDGSVSFDEMVKSYESILNELNLYNPQILEEKAIITVLSKMDADIMDQSSDVLRFKGYLTEHSIEFYEISALNRKGLTELLDHLMLTLLEKKEIVS